MTKYIPVAVGGLSLLMAAGLAFPALAQVGGAAVTIENCGRTLEFDEAPERIVSIGQGTTEILLSLGLADRIAGTATWVSDLPGELAEAGANLPRIAENTPGFEAVVGTRPDMVAVQWINDIGPEQGRVGTFAQFEDFGIPVYVSPAECAKSEFGAASGDGARSEAWSSDLLYREVAELADIGGVPSEGEALIADSREREAAAARDAEALAAEEISVVYWFSSPEIDGEAWLAGGYGAPQWISNVIGLRNVVDSHEEWPLVGWETIADHDPDVIVLGTMKRRNQPADNVALKREFLETDPLTSQMTAVHDGRLVELDAHAMNPTLRAIDGVARLAEAISALGLTR
ncbi:ABC transporter substrate-binding protein [Roseivivax sediminis]|uniref:Iron complex transport system substrate-binding protein n=1 Tax=Roseivivax sediminis TaxID=936889 RepID=A0A1I1WB03_9RHOB|nr:ABC transporter substrate-binding protein [Roseivivax sediminis]SFD92211.1 iron complex transport system substrate-binding protein [Roseivivax sediminis]